MFGNIFTRSKIDFDFLAIGDVVIDAFIKLRDAHVHENLDMKGKELCMGFGDKIPYESVDIVPAVGNSPNAAVAASRLGLKSALLAYVGRDLNGKDCLEALRKDRVNIKYVRIDKNNHTNYHYVLWYGAERTILVKHALFPYAMPADLPPVAWIYLSSLAENSLAFHLEIAGYLKRNPETKLAFQPGTFQIKLGREKLKDLYAKTYVFFCNKEEAQRILETDESDILELMAGLHKLGPKIVSVTDGPAGAYASDGESAWFIPMYPDIAPPINRTGAGDAYSSTFAVALSLGKTIPEALSWGPINSMNVVQYVGAQKGLLSQKKIEEYLSNAPVSYKVTKII